MEALTRLRRIVVFGAGDAGRRAIAALDSSVSVVAVCDNDSSKHGRSIAGHPIVAPSRILELDPDRVLIASMYWREIRIQLLDLDVSAERIEIHPASEGGATAAAAHTVATRANDSIPDWMAPDLRPRNSAVTPLVSIILPTWNRQATLARAIDSALAQTYRHFELIVIDDGSDDATHTILKNHAAQDSRIRALRQSRRGASAARNRGLAAAGGELIAYLDSDNCWHPDYLALMVRGFEDGRRETGYAGFNVFDFRTGRFRTVVTPFDHEALIKSSGIDLNTFMHRNAVAQALGGFDESMTRLVDWELILRYTRLYPPFVLGCALADYYVGDRLRRLTDTEPFRANRELLEQRFLTPPSKPARQRGPLRVAYVQHEFPALSQTFVQNEISRLLELGIHVSVFYFRESMAKATVPCDWDVARFSSREELAWMLVSRRIDLVHAHFAVPHPADFIVPVCERLRLPFTIKPHAFDIFRRDHDRRHHIAHSSKRPLCASVYCEGRYHQEFLAAEGVPHEKLLVIRNVFDDAPFRAVQNVMQPKVRRIISISRFVKKKGYHLLIPAFRLIDDAEIRLDIYGYGPELAHLEELASSDPRVSINPGPQSPDEAAACLSGADLFALPCLRDGNGDTDGLPTVLMEAMAAGVPVLTTPIASVPDLVIHGETGLMVKSGSIEELARALRRAVQMSSDERARLVAGARQLLYGEFDPDLNARRLLRDWQQTTGIEEASDAEN